MLFDFVDARKENSSKSKWLNENIALKRPNREK